MSTAPMNTDERLDRIESEIGLLKADVSDLKKGQAEIKTTLSQVMQLLARIDGRLDEQRATINALIPMRLAAVPPAAE